MADDLLTLDPQTYAPPASRIKDAASLNSIVTRYITADGPRALSRIDVQQMVDGAPPYDPRYISDSGQEGRCNLNFGDGKASVKAEMVGYYDLTDSVPMLARISTPLGADSSERSLFSNIISEEFHRMIKEWKAFDSTHQLLTQKFVTHGLGFTYFSDDVDWRWCVAGLNDFKLPDGIGLSEDECDCAIVLRDIPVGKLYGWIKDLSADDKRFNRMEVQKAILNASNSTVKYSQGEWEKYQQTLKNNDLFASATAQSMVKLAHAWVREFDGKVSHYITLRDGGNEDFLFKCIGRFDCVDQCFTFFPYEIGTNGSLHSVRGRGHEVLAAVQVLNSLRCQTVDNAKLSGSLLLQPKTPTDAEDMAILFYAGAAYIPPGVEVRNGNLNNPSSGILPVIQDMTMTLRRNTGDHLSSAADSSNEKTKFQVQSELMKEAVLPTANLNLFYQPWGRHLAEVWRRANRKGVSKNDPGGEAVLAMRKRCTERGVPMEAILAADQVMAMRAVGYGSPTNRLLALDEFMQYYGSLDPVGQNNLLRDRFAQRVGYAQVDDYVPRIEAGGRAPLDQEIAELQNMLMSAGTPASVLPNDNHIIHTQTHMPSLTEDLDHLEAGEGTPQLLASAQLKAQHIANHMHNLKPDKLQGKVVAELHRQFNNAAERVHAATIHSDRMIAKKQQQDAQLAAQAQAQAQGGAAAAGPSKAQQDLEAHKVRQQIMIEDHQLKMRLTAENAQQQQNIRDVEAANRLRAEASRTRLRNEVRVEPAPQVPLPAPLSTPSAPALPLVPQ